MNENDLSDEAFWSCTDGMTRLQAWQECRRRAESKITEANFAQFDTITKQAKEIADLKQWIAILEQRERKNDPAA